ncbi:MAG: hypothetical protein OEW48_13605 [Phycisphaerae bacterium]|nr:hypothetical protein [Phycisphaerae bacterium]
MSKKIRCGVLSILFFVLAFRVVFNTCLHKYDEFSWKRGWHIINFGAMINDIGYVYAESNKKGQLFMTIREAELFDAGPRLVVLIEVYLNDLNKPKGYQLRIDRDGLVVKPPQTLTILEEMFRREVFDDEIIPKHVRRQIALIVMNQKEQKLDKDRFI